jgi:hypothetical protein
MARVRIGTATNQALGLLYEDLLRQAGIAVTCEIGSVAGAPDFSQPSAMWIEDDEQLADASIRAAIAALLGRDCDHEVLERYGGAIDPGQEPSDPTSSDS